MRRITQQTITDILDALEFTTNKYLEVCRIVTGLAEQFPHDSALATAIIQNTAGAEFDIYRQLQILHAERTNIAATRVRNNYLRRRRAETAPIYTDDDLDLALGERGLPTPDLVDE